ncbi:uncharacterized protein LOC110104415 [Dendrobium catenatum]|uniref:uncharacterized protein LOC110104415 n=1 Tax=Dendrobium catenatum TaxID=906689 RepID=UPI0009F27FDE|nr:uncharacterized protein LOC110104415 [Dendrobium catenatum]
MCRVTFSIGKYYASEVLCDVLDMDICHLILGRPWQFDTGVTYDGCANAYSFEWKGRKLRLIPNSQPQHTPVTTASNDQAALSVISGNSLMQLWRERKALITVYMTEGNSETEATSSPLELLQPLTDFADVVSIDQLDQLPPLHSIQHQIDFKPGASLPNLPHYKMSPMERQNS